MKRLFAAAAVATLLLLPFAALSLAQPEPNASISAPEPVGDATVIVPTSSGGEVAVQPVPAPADVPPFNITMLIPVLAMGLTPLIWLLTYLVKTVYPDVTSAKVKLWIGTALGGGIALLTYLTGAFPSTTWMQTILSFLTAMGSGLGGALGAGLMHNEGVKAVTGEALGVPGPPGARGLRGRPGESGASSLALIVLILLVLVLWGGGLALHVGSGIHLLLLVIVIIVVLALVRGRGNDL